MKLLEVNSSSTEGSKDLFGSEGEKVSLQVAGIKIPKEREKQILRIKLPHCPLPPTRDVCLFVKDLEKGEWRVVYDATHGVRLNHRIRIRDQVSVEQWCLRLDGRHLHSAMPLHRAGVVHIHLKGQLFHNPCPGQFPAEMKPCCSIVGWNSPHYIHFGPWHVS